MSLLGRPIRRIEDPKLLRGQGEFIANLEMPPGAVCVGYLTATIAHARIASIDVTAAREAPGVVDIVVADDLPFAPETTLHEAMPRPYLASGVVRFVGEPVVAVLAESAAALEDALDLIVVDYDPLPAVVDTDDAATGSTLLFPEAGTNVAASIRGGAETEAAWGDFEVVVEGTFVNQRIAACPMETRVAAAWWTDEGRLIQHLSCQGPHAIRGIIAKMYGLDIADVRVISRDVGGAFGAKGRPYPEDLLLPFLSRRVGRPVRWIPARSTDMVGLGHSRAQRQHVKIGGDRDGTIRALQVHVQADAGAYPYSAPNLMRNTGLLLPGPYRIENVRWSADAIMTNTTPIVAFRGAGRPEAAAIVDRAIDLFAAEIGADPVEVRRRNLLRSDELPWTNPNGITYDSGDYAEALDRALRTVGYDELRADQRARRERGDRTQLGIGLSVFIDRTAGLPGKEYGSVALNPDGSLTVMTGAMPNGQGHHTSWAQLASERTGIPMDRITIVHGDTDVVPRGTGTGGSRSAQRGGAAVAEATEMLVEAARERAAGLLEADASDVVLDVDRAAFHVSGAPAAATVTWSDVAATLGERGGLACETDFTPDGPTIPYGAYVAVVEVDTETGRTTLVRFVAVDDAGTIINPLLATGQVHGGLGQGIAQALYEEFAYDEDGNPVTSTFVDYLIPSAADLPSYESELMETPSPLSRYGFKGIAESGTIGAPPAVQNAVVDALSHLGVRHLDLPVTPERVWRAISSATGALTPSAAS